MEVPMRRKILLSEVTSNALAVIYASLDVVSEQREGKLDDGKGRGKNQCDPSAIL